MMTKIAILLLSGSMILGTMVLLNETSAQEKSRRQKNKIQCDKTLLYKKCDGGDLNLYVFLPEKADNDADAETKPAAIVFFFGGGWVGGTPKQFEPHAKYLKSRGMVAILADYRTKRSHKTSPQECVADAKSAIRYVRSNAKKLNLDPQRVVAAGGSAGGHLAAATATLTAFDDSKDDVSVSCCPNALVLFNPVYNNGPGQWGHKSVKDYWKKISPAANIKKGMPPAIVFLGDKDKLISVKTAKSFQNEMKKIGSRSELHIYPGAGHGFFNYGRRGNKAFRDTVTKMDRFLVSLRFLDGKADVDDFLKRQQKK